MKNTPIIIRIISLIIIGAFVLYYFTIGKDKANLQKAYTYQNAASYNKALTYFNKVLKRDPRNAQVYFNIAICQNKLGENKAAVEALYNAIKYKPDYFEAHFLMGFIEASEEHYDKALASFNEARNIEPRAREVYLNLANVYNSLEKYDNAIYSYKKAIELDPTWVLAYYQLGVACYSAGRLDEAVEAFKKVAELEPYYPDTYSNLAVIFEDKGDMETALYYWKKRIDTADPKDPALATINDRYLSVREMMTAHEKI